jgi:hypothetical protein
MIERSGLVEYSTASALAETYRAEMEKIESHFLALGESCDRLRAAFVENGAHSYDFSIEARYRSNNEHLTPEGFRRIRDEFHRSAWRCLVAKLDIRKIMSSSAQQMLEAQLEGKTSVYHNGQNVPLGRLPEITAENILSVLEGMLGQAGDLLEEKIREEFEFWKPWRERHKTDDVNALAPKIIKSGMIQYSGYRNYWDATYYERRAHFQSLDSVFHLLDGKGIPPEHDGEFITAIRSAGKDGKGETAYFKFKCFHNGNIHIKFKRLDLLREFNRVAGGQNLGKKREHTRGTTAV